MVQINMTRDEKEAVSGIDRSELQRQIDQCIYEERTGGIHSLGLSRCGLYVASALRNFERALGDYSKAKSSKKREDTRTSVLRAGSDLVHAVQIMKDRAETEQQDGQFFYVEDQILPPVSLREQLTVRISYKWRRSVEDNWTHNHVYRRLSFDIHVHLPTSLLANEAFDPVRFRKRTGRPLSTALQH